MVSTAAFHARVRGSFPNLGSLKETKMFLPHSLVKLSIVGSLRDREVACSISDLQGLNFESCVWRAVSSHSYLSILRRFSGPSPMQPVCAQKWPKARFISFLKRDALQTTCARQFLYPLQSVNVPVRKIVQKAIAIVTMTSN